MRSPGRQWLRSTGGNLTRTQSSRLVVEVMRAQSANLAGRLRLQLGRGSQFDPEPPRIPDSRAARRAEEVWRAQGPVVANHAARTWMFGAALAQVDDVALEPEQFYIACLLHDSGALSPVAGEDFTVRSCDMSTACMRAGGASPSAIADVEQAIAVHLTPGIEPEADGPLGCYVQAGAMLDLVALRLWDVDPVYVARVRGAFEPGELRPVMEHLLRQEAAAVPRGRVALLNRWGLLLALRMSPLASRG